MSYTPTTWTTGDTITASALNKIENGIADAGGATWDAVIRLTHAENSGQDTTTNLTPSIVSGTFSALYNKVSNGGCPCVLVEYLHPWGPRYAVPMAYIVYATEGLIRICIAGFSTITDSFTKIGILDWDSNNGISWE